MRDFSGIATPEIFTLNDLVHRMTLRTSGKATEQHKALVTRAIQDAIRSLPAKHDWSFFRRQSRFTASPIQSNGITYDHSGGSVERLVTITSGNYWPQDAEYGQLRIGEQTFRILRRLSDTTVQLESDFSLRGDFTGTVSWERRAYRFSREITRIHYLHDITADRAVPYLAPSDFQESSYTEWGHGTRHVFTWQNHGGRFGSSEIILLPAPNTNNIFEVSATVNPHIPSIVSIASNDASVTQGTTSVSSAGSSFTSRLIGSVFRLSIDASPPVDFKSSDWEFQAFITDVPDSNTLTLSEVVPSTASGRGFVISSPVELEASVHLEYIEDEAYFQYCKNHDHRSLQQSSQVANSSLRAAMARDNKVSLNSRMWVENSAYPWSTGFFHVDGIVDTSTTEGENVSESTIYVDDLPANAVGNDGDQAYIKGGNLEGAVYEKTSGVWVYITTYQYALRDSHPATGSLPSGFRWRLVGQANSTDNGIYEWDGSAITQLTDE